MVTPAKTIVMEVSSGGGGQALLLKRLLIFALSSHRKSDY
jgi:hypothetical protein